MNERAVSPLIATIFLIAVSVALGSIVMTLGQDYVNQAEPHSGSCGIVDYEIKKVSYNQADSTLEIAFDNGETFIDSLIIKIFDKTYSNGYSAQVNGPISPFEVKIIKITVDSQKVPVVHEIKIIPQLSSGACTDSAKEITSSSPLFSTKQ